MLREIQKEIQRLKTIKVKICGIIQNAPKENLRCIMNKGCPQFYLGKSYLRKKEWNVAKDIASRDYARALDKTVDRYLKVLTELEQLYRNEELENVYRGLRQYRKELLNPLITPIEEQTKQFESINYEGKRFEPEDRTEYYTVKGERVRSKSEKIIADELYRYNIPYKYEMPIELANGNKKIMIYSDFTVLNRQTGRRWIIEHFGMMDNPVYYERTLQKIDMYERNGILIGRDLIVLHEASTSPLNINTVRNYIEEYLC